MRLQCCLVQKFGKKNCRLIGHVRLSRIKRGDEVMNREQKRKFVKNAKKKGVKGEDAKTYAEIIGNGAGRNTDAQEISEGEKIMLDINSIKNRENYESLTGKYKEFVNNSANKVFTAHVERAHTNLISLKEEPMWLFWSGDLIKIKEDIKE